MRYKNEDKLRKVLEFIENTFETYKEVPTIRDIASHINLSTSNAHAYVQELVERDIVFYTKSGKLTTKKIQKMKGGYVNVALVGSVACGQPLYAEENIEEYFSLPEKLVGGGKFFLLRANGESMINAGIEDGDLVLIRQQNNARPGDIVVALCEETETTLKRYYPEDRRIRLKPENDKMKDILVDSCTIQGVAIKVLKDL